MIIVIGRVSGFILWFCCCSFFNKPPSIEENSNQSRHVSRNGAKLTDFAWTDFSKLANKQNKMSLVLNHFGSKANIYFVPSIFKIGTEPITEVYKS